jgi:tRNA A-37 threonylcarbamoyl transferase component Bud32
MQVVNLNKYYGDGFAEVMIDEGHKYIKMRRIEGVDLSQIEKGSLPPNARTLIDDVLAQMEAKDIFHNDPQLKNFMYSSKENKIYPIDLDGMSAEFMVPVVRRAYDRQTVELRNAFRELIAQEP